MQPDLNLRYSIPDEEWARTAGMRWDNEAFPLYHCFFGHVHFTVGGEEVLEPAPFDISIADLAVGLAEVLEGLQNVDTGILRFQQSDDSLCVLFDVSGAKVNISHNLSSSRWTCTRDGMQRGIVEFVRHFSHAVALKIDRPFEWGDMQILRQFDAEESRGGGEGQPE